MYFFLQIWTANKPEVIVYREQTQTCCRSNQLWAWVAPFNVRLSIPTSIYLFSRYDAVLDYLDFLASNHPDLVKLETLGKTHEGRKIVLVKISPEGNEDKNSNIVWMDGGRKVIKSH